MPSPAIAARNRVAVAARLGDTAAERTARQDLAAAKISAFISSATLSQPPLRPEQREALAAQVLAGGAA